MTYPIPDEALKETGAIIGRVGSGKTYTAKGIVERQLRVGMRVIIIDPTGVWWGLRSSAAGNAGAFPVVVFGGDHKDVPITEDSGIALAVTLAGQNLPAIIDVSQFTVGERTRFMTAFLETLYHENRAPLMLVVDEADMFAPQRLMPDQTRMFSRMEQICRRGRVRGFRPWLITQRPAELHKSVLSQANTLVAMQLNAPQDRDAVGAWIEGQADRDEGKKVLADLPKLKKGEGWVWCPSHDVLKRVKFPAITTFDSSRSPEDGEKLPQLTLAEVDLSAIESSLKECQAAVEGDDVDLLRKKIARLEAEKPRPDTAALEAEYQRGRDDAHCGAASYGHEARSHMEMVRRHLDEVERILVTVEELAAVRADVKPAMPIIETIYGTDPSSSGVSTALVRRAPTARTTVPAGAMTKAQRAILTVMAQTDEPCSRGRLSILSGYSIKSSSFANALSALRVAGYAEGGDAFRITARGRQALGKVEPLPKDRAAYWMSRLGKAEAAIFDVVLKRYPNAMSREEVSRASGYSVTSSSFANALSALRGLELIYGRAEVKASREFFQ